MIFEMLFKGLGALIVIGCFVSSCWVIVGIAICFSDRRLNAAIEKRVVDLSMECLLQEREDYHRWWENEGSAMRPEPDEDQEAHVARLTRIAWENGAYASRRALIAELQKTDDER